MTTNIRELAESHLKFSLESGWWGMPVELLDPDGDWHLLNTLGEPITGQVCYETIVVNPATGEDMVVNKPVVSLRISSLVRVPQDGEKWLVRIPISPDVDAEKEDFVLSPTRPIEAGRSIGFIRLYLQRAEQSP